MTTRPNDVAKATDGRSRVPPREEAVTRYVLERRAALHPDRPFLRLPDGSTVSYETFHSSVQWLAAGLAGLGVKQGDTVNVWLPNTIDIVRVWFAINWLGAIYVPINTAYRGGVLSHVLGNGGASVIVAHAGLLERFEGIDRGMLRTVVVVGDAVGMIDGLECVPIMALDREPREMPDLARPIEPWDSQSIIYTSGTTGRSKGVVSSYAHMWHMASHAAYPMLDENDNVLCFLPFFHIGGTLPLCAMLYRGGSLGLGGEFATERFWPIVRATQATYTILLGVMSNFLSRLPRSAGDRAHPLKKVTMIPLPGDWRDFAERFGVDVWTLFNMTELNTPIVSVRNPDVPGTCGRARPGNELRIVDEYDREAPTGSVGELIIRSDDPWALNSGYFRSHEATALAWRNGWFHTGDAFRVDADGNYFFVDRFKDAIRRRGENVSSFEVEAEILAHAAVRECAVVAVSNDVAEDDVLAIVAPAPGAEIDPAELLEFLRPRLAHFMVPRYVRIVAELPRTPTQKVEKYVLRAQGLTPDNWDREKAGLRFKRDRFAD